MYKAFGYLENEGSTFKNAFLAKNKYLKKKGKKGKIITLEIITRLLYTQY